MMLHPAAQPARSLLRPGETVKESGVYRVLHGQPHRRAHEVVIVRGDVLPSCRVCKSEVRFELARECEHVSQDWDLAGPSEMRSAA